MKNYITLLLFGILFSGCVTKVDMDKYRPLQAKSALPSYITPKQPPLSPNIVVLNRNGTPDYFNDLIAHTFFNQNNRRPLFEITDSAQSVEVELYLDELYSEKEFSKKKRKTKDEDGNEIEYEVGSWHFSTNATVSVKILYPNGNFKRFSKSEYKIYTKEALSLNSYLYNELEDYDISFDEVVADATESIFKRVADELVPYGNIVDVMVNKEDQEDFIFLINMGMALGLKQGQRIDLYTPAFIDYGRISDQLLVNSAWIVVDKDIAKNLKIGDKVRPRF